MKFQEYGGVLVCKVPGEDRLDQGVIEQIVSHTANTWQQGRGTAETRRNTVQGKQAELVMEKFLEKNTRFRYLSYDDFRKDGFKKHAPFDGLLYQADFGPKRLEKVIAAINGEVDGDEVGQITPRLRMAMAKAGVFTFEIKSSQMREKDYEGVGHIREGRTAQDYQRIAENLRRWDFFVYPCFTRTSSTIQNFYDYAEFVHEQHPGLGRLAAEYLGEIMKTEYCNASDIYTRLYFDRQTGEIFLPGYVLKESFFHHPKIIHMPGAKSGKALYYAYSIANGTPFSQLDGDRSILHYGWDSVQDRLFAVRERACPDCGRTLKLCNTAKRRTYTYRCDHCDRWFHIDSID